MSKTIKDVARKAGVSIATVSRVFKGEGNVSEELKKRVLKAAKELNYTPNHLARALALKKTFTIGVILPEAHSEFFSEIIRGVDLEARKNNYHILVASSHSDIKEVNIVVSLMSHGKVDGLIIMYPNVIKDPSEIHLPENIPIVLLNSFHEKINCDVVLIDNYNGANLMARHLIKHAHRRIAVIKGPGNNHDTIERLKGFRDAVEKVGSYGVQILEYEGDFTEESGFKVAKQILSLPPEERPTAIFCMNDSMAIGALDAIDDAGLKVPADIAVVGFDDIPVAKYLKPSLTSVHVPIFKLGVVSAKRLLKRIQEPNLPPEKIVIESDLIVRESCGCL